MIGSNKNILKLALDVGNLKVKGILGEMNSECTKMRVLKYIEVPTEGMKKSVVENPEKLAFSISKVINEIEDESRDKIDKVSIGIGGKNIKSRTINVKRSFSEKEITEMDIESLYEEAEDEILQGRNRVLKREIYNIRVNNAGIVKNPLGLLGTELQGDIHIIYIAEEEVEKLVEVINRLGLEVEDIYLNAYASAKSTLDEESQKMGVALIDIGEGSTDIILLKNNKIIYSQSFSLGGMHFVNDISYLFKIPREIGVEILNKFQNRKSDDEYIFYGDDKKVAVQDIKEIINARAGDITDFISRAISESGFNGYLGKGIVLTGGAAVLDGLAEKINSKTLYVVRKNKPISFQGLEKTDYQMATVIGIFIEAMESEYLKRQDSLYGEVDDEDEDEDFDDEDDRKNKEIDDVDERNGGFFKSIKKWFSYFI